MRRAALPALLCALALAACGTAQQPPTPESTPASSAHPDMRYLVVSITDGDTFRINTGPVRVLGIDTPELSNTTAGKPDCYAQEATAKTKDLLQGTSVFLTPDPEQGDKDRYNRLLRYVTTDRGEDLAAYLLRYGYAKVYEEYPVQRTSEYLRLQDQARAEQRGLWKDCP